MCKCGIKINIEGKLSWTCRGGGRGEVEIQLHSVSTSVLDGMNGQRHAQAYLLSPYSK